MANYKNLIVFQKADELAFRIYKATESFPKSEVFGLTSQLRRAALSIPTNIVEGYARKSKKELLQFINISMGSHAETEYLFGFSKRLGYVKSGSEEIEELISSVGRLLWKFRESL
jgi:four helix bundle protein